MQCFIIRKNQKTDFFVCKQLSRYDIDMFFLQFIRSPSSKVGKIDKSWVISIPSIPVVIVYFQSLWKNVDPDQVASSIASLMEPDDLDLHCFLKRINPRLLLMLPAMTPVLPYFHHTKDTCSLSRIVLIRI